MANAPLTDILAHLAPLISFNTTNPPREITGDGPLIAYLREALPGFDISVRDLGSGSVIFEAVRGAPRVMFNVHMDTVPVADGWSRDPFSLLQTEDRVLGLGVCDIKGAAACLLTLAANTEAPMRLLFTTDEEAGQSACIREYVSAPPDVEQVIVAEPTSTKAVLQHRGIYSAKMEFSGTSAHSSSGTPKSAVHDAAHWITRALSTGVAPENRLNVGRIEGGVKPNMIAAHAELLFGFRTQPGTAHEDVLAEIDRAAGDIVGERTTRFAAPALPKDHNGTSAAAQAKALNWCRTHDVPVADPVDFFTEASFFAEAGLPSIVLGPGDIAQAHTADEWVSYEQLEATYAIYASITENAA